MPSKQNKQRIAAITASLVLSSAMAQTWVQTPAPTRFWTSIASSADGLNLAATGFGGLYTSPDGGMTWTSNTIPGFGPLAVACSGDGSKLIAAQHYGSIFTSEDSGATWRSNNAPVDSWTGVACSSDGRKLVAVAGAGNGLGPIYLSTNSGATWTASGVPMRPWGCVASSADGSRLAAGDEAGYIYISTNSGAAWSPTSAPFETWYSIASSVDGSILVAVAYYASIYTSRDGGTTWTEAPSTYREDWSGVTCSADGTRFVAATIGSGNNGSPGAIFCSQDSGVTWLPTSAPNNSWPAITCSADGNRLIAVVSGGPVYVGQFPPTPLLSAIGSGNQIDLSWIVPSLDFRLQQNSDLTASNWTDWAAAPNLNLTNLHYEVAVPRSSPTTFYRLKH